MFCVQFWLSVESVFPVSLRQIGIKSLATVICGRFLVPDGDWVSEHFGDIADDATLDGASVRDFLLKSCRFSYIVHSVII